MKKPINPQQILQWQTAVITALLVVIFIISLYQLPAIAEFFQTYGSEMKAAFPQPR